MKTLSTNQLATAGQPYTLIATAWARLGMAMLAAGLLVGLLVGMVSLSQAAPLAPNPDLTMTSSPAGTTQPALNPPSSAFLLPGDQVVYTITLRNNGSAADRQPNFIRDRLPPGMEIVSVNPATSAQSGDVQNGYVLTWTLPNDVPGGSLTPVVVTARLATSGNVLKRLLENKAEGTLSDISGSLNDTTPPYLYHYLNVTPGVGKSHTTSVIAAGNSSQQAVAGEAVTMTVFFTIPRGTLAYNAVPRVLVQDGLWVTGASETHTLTTTQAAVDVQKATGNFTQLEFEPRTITDTDSITRSMVFTVYAVARQAYFLGTSGDPTSLSNGLLVQPILRWCETPGCTVNFADTRYYAENETLPGVVVRRPLLTNPTIGYSPGYPNATPPNGGDPVRFTLNAASNGGTNPPAAYDLVLNVVLGPGLSLVTATNPVTFTWSKVGDVTIITWTAPSLAGGTAWNVAPRIDVTLPQTFVIGSRYTCTAQIRYSTLPGDVPDEGIQYANYTSPGVGGFIMPVGTPDKRAFPANVTIGDQVTYTLITRLGAGTVLYSPSYTDALRRGFHYISGTLRVQGALTTGLPITAPGALDQGLVREELGWRMDTVDNTDSASTYVFTATYQTLLTGLDVNGEPTFAGETQTLANAANKYQDFRNLQSAGTNAILYWLASPGDASSRTSTNTSVPGPHNVAQPFLSTGGGGVFTTQRRGVSDYGVGDTLSFRTTVRNSTQGGVNAYEVQVCDQLPPEVEIADALALAPPLTCPGAKFLDKPQAQAQGTVCWTIDKVCPAGDFEIDYTLRVLPAAIPGVWYKNQAYITDYSSQVGDTKPFDRHYRDFASVTGTTGVVYPLALPFSVSDVFKVIGLEASKSTAASAVGAGERITYSLAYTDTSPDSNYTNLVITDSYDAYLEYVSANPAPVVTDTAGRRLVWNVASVPASGRQEIELVLRTLTVLPGTLTAVTNTLAWDAQASNPAREQPPLTWSVTTPIEAPNPHVQLSGPETSYAGETVTYTVVYSNDGTTPNDVNLTLDYGPYLSLITYTASVTDRLSYVSDEHFVDNSVPNDGKPCTLTLILQVDAPLPYLLDHFTSGVTVDSPGAPAKMASWTTNLLYPKFVFSKTGPDTAPPPGPSNLMMYNFTLINTGTLTATNIVITDTWDTNTSFASGGGWAVNGDSTYATYTIASLAPGAAASIDALIVTVDLEQDLYTNRADLSCQQTVAPSIAEPTWAPSIATSKSVTPDPAFPGRVLTYTVYYTNTAGSATHVRITDTLPAGFSYLGHTADGAGCLAPGWQFIEPAGGDAVWTCASMLKDATGHMQIWGLVTAGEDTWLVNVTESGGDPPVPVRTIEEPMRTRVARPHLAVVKSADTRPVATGDSITYTLVYSNYGTEAAYETLVVDELPDGVAFAGCPGGACTHDAGVVSWSLGTVPTGTLDSLTLVVQASGAAQTVTNAGYRIRSSKLSTAETTAGAPVSIDIRAPQLTLVKQAYPPTVSALNAPIVYTLTYTNDGGGALHHVVISDVLSNLVSFIGASPSCSHSGGAAGGVVTCLIGDLDQGQAGSVSIQVQNVTTINGSEIVNQAQALARSHAQGLVVEAESEPASVMYIDPNQCIPVWYPSFSVAPAVLKAGEPVTLSGQVYTGTPPIQYAWNFGDDQTGENQTAHHTYAVSGTYTVVMTASNTCDSMTYSRSTSRQVVVLGEAQLAVNPGQLDVFLGAGGQSARTLLVSNAGTTGMAWSIAESPEADWLQVAPASGALEPGGSVSVLVTFTAPTTQGVYLTTLSVDGGAGGLANVPVTMTVQEACVEMTSVSIAGAISGLPGVYTFTATYQPSSATAPSYLWDNGDTTGASVRSLVVGSHTLTVTADNGCSVRTDTHTIIIGLAPEASFTSATEVGIGEPITFTNTSVGAEPLSYVWTFGDGVTSTLENPTHAYTATGPFTVTLTVSNDYGEDSAEAVITVRPAAGYAVYLPVVVKNQ
ncbi:MAG: DUF11 domain-containing protein [Thermoflexales bacterium]|nr:DUF11 domain-containing protein [Thermoflexales bacterium]